MTTGISLVADIGGTNTRVALTRSGALLPDTIARFRNRDHASLDEVLDNYLAAQDGVACDAACAALAGPVRDGRGTMTNLDWTITETRLAEAANAKAGFLLNDLQAQGHALGYLPEAATRLIHGAGASDPKGAKLVIGIGTGFNIAPVYDVDDRRVVPASEAGHASLPLRSESDLELARALEAELGFAAIEDMLSGRGVEAIYRQLSRAAGAEASLEGHDIMARATSETDPIALATARAFSETLGVVAGNLALNHLPFGGIFLAGGVARAFADHLTAWGFPEAFHDKGRFAPLMDEFAISVIEDDYAALLGCARYIASRNALVAS
jgi:glucokinase